MSAQTADFYLSDFCRFVWWLHTAVGCRVVRPEPDDGEGPKYLDFHALRHSYISALAASGTDPKTLQTLARHSDPRMTLDVYTRLEGEGRKAEAVGRLALPVSGQADPLAGLTREQVGGLVLFAP